MLLAVDEQTEEEPIIQLQFNEIKDVEYMIEKLEDLKNQMRLYKNG